MELEHVKIAVYAHKVNFFENRSHRDKTENNGYTMKEMGIKRK